MDSLVQEKTVTKNEVIKKQKEELDRFREVFALAVEGDDS